MKRRSWEPDIMMAIFLEGLRGIRTVAEICREYQCSETQYYKWRDKFLDGGKRALHGDLGGEVAMKPRLSDCSVSSASRLYNSRY